MPTPPTPTNKQYRFSKEADALLDAKYTERDATTTPLKIATLEIELGGTFNYYAFGGEINDEMKLTSLEYEYLERMGKIELIFA